MQRLEKIVTETTQSLPTALACTHDEATEAHVPMPLPYTEDPLLIKAVPPTRVSQEYCDAIMDRSGIIGS